MTEIQEELAQLQTEFVQLINRWNGLSRLARERACASYSRSLDEGESGYHPWRRILMNAWCEGWNAISGVALDGEGSLGPAMQVSA